MLSRVSCGLAVTMIFGFVLVLRLLCHLGEASPATYSIKSRDCLPPTLHDCSVIILTAPPTGSFSTYCIVDISTSSRELVPTWRSLNESLDANHTSTDNSMALCGKLARNFSIIVSSDIRKSDRDVYVLKALCDKAGYSVTLTVKEGGCHNYCEPPNAIHCIISNNSKILESDTFALLCMFNADAEHDNITWQKDSESHDKYHNHWRVSCPAGKPCCSFTCTLVVSRAIHNDSGVYICSASGGFPDGPPHPVVEPREQNSTNDLSLDLVISISSGGAVVIFAVHILIITMICVKLKRARRRRKSYQLLVNGGFEDGSSYYGSISQSLQLTNSVRPATLVNAGKPPIFILYGLELEPFHNVKYEDCPAYDLITDFVQFLETCGVHCYHDAVKSISSDSLNFPDKVETAVQEARTVIVICSEVLNAAFAANSHSAAMVQMKFGRFNVQSILRLMKHSPEKFIPVFLAGGSPLCEVLHSRKGYNLWDFESFRLKMREDAEIGAAELLRRPEYGELRDFIERLRTS